MEAFSTAEAAIMPRLADGYQAFLYHPEPYGQSQGNPAVTVTAQVVSPGT
jgi:hypothetical protein